VTFGPARVSSGGCGRRIGELVPHGDHAFHVPHDGDKVMAHLCGLRAALQAYHAVPHGHREPGRVGEELPEQDLVDDLPADVRVRPSEHAEHVGPIAVAITVSKILAPRLSVAGATARLEAAGQPFVFFVNSHTSRGSLIYHRYDGHYGLVEPAS
jgi:hypothetical protein